MFENVVTAAREWSGAAPTNMARSAPASATTIFVHPGFCDNCVRASTDVPGGGTFTLNGIGTRLYGSGDRCPICQSVVQRLFFCVLFIPLIPIRKYRVKYIAPARFLSRRIARNATY
jgi:hypothetical protein